MKLPKKLQVKCIIPSSIKVYHFEDKLENSSIKSNPHYHICLPVDNDQFILLVMMTSSVDKIKNQYKTLGKELLDSLIELDKTSGIQVVTKDTIIDCNKPKYKTCEELAETLIGDRVIFLLTF